VIHPVSVDPAICLTSRRFSSLQLWLIVRTIYLILIAPFFLSGCSVIAVADAAVSVVATGVSVGATVVGTTVDVAATGVKALTGSGDEAKKD
jgi:hypothetical protein